MRKAKGATPCATRARRKSSPIRWSGKRWSCFRAPKLSPYATKARVTNRRARSRRRRKRKATSHERFKRADETGGRHAGEAAGSAGENRRDGNRRPVGRRHGEDLDERQGLLQGRRHRARALERR